MHKVAYASLSSEVPCPALPAGAAAGSSLALPAPALGQSYSRPEVVPGPCQPEGRDEFAIVGADRIASTEEGTLHADAAQDVQREPRWAKGPRRGKRDTPSCSPTKPAIMANQDGRTMAYFLAPFGSESREAVRRNANFHAVYFAVCHGLEAGQASVRDLPGLA